MEREKEKTAPPHTPFSLFSLTIGSSFLSLLSERKKKKRGGEGNDVGSADLEPDYGVDPLVWQLVVHLGGDERHRLGGDLDGGDDEEGAGGGDQVAVGLAEELPGHGEDVRQGLVGQDAGALVQQGEGHVEEAADADLHVFQDGGGVDVARLLL